MEEKNTINPWEVKGKIDYNKLLEEFGAKRINENQKKYLKELAKKKNLDEHIFLKRDLFYAQMDLDKIINAHKEGKKIFLYTGRAPGGSMHIGHLISFEFTKYLQEIFDANLIIQIPDDEKFLFKKELKLNEIEPLIKEDITELISIGFNPEKTFIFRNSEYIKNMYPLVLEISKRLTFSQVRNTFGFENSSNIGQIFYPSLQIAPSMFENGYCLIPCGIDQNPYFLLQRDIAPKLGFEKNSTILSKFLPPLTGIEGKMSASDPNKAILLTDNEKEVKKKVNKYAFSGGKPTIEEHRKYGGNCDIDISYIWLYYLFENDDKEIEKIRIEYSSGKMLSGEIKKILIDKINNYLKAHREKKEIAIKNNLLEKYTLTGEFAKKMQNKIHTIKN
jgi:tryptophanyl-tRNA synthetase